MTIKNRRRIAFAAYLPVTTGRTALKQKKGPAFPPALFLFGTCRVHFQRRHPGAGLDPV